MQIIIVSHKRPRAQITWDELPASIKEKTKIAVYEDEVDDYSNYPTITIPEEYRGIGRKRHYLLQHVATDKVCILDDDLVFATRRQDEPAKFSPSTIVEVETMFKHIEKALDEFAHGAVSMREGANRDTNEFRFNSRALRLHFYNAREYRRLGIRFDRLPFMEDFDVTLQFLEQGLPNVILNKWVHNQSGSNTHGGCAGMRDAQKQAAAAHSLAELHSHVKVVKKKTKDGWCADENGERTDVTIYWKKTYESSGTAPILDNDSLQNLAAKAIRG